MEAGEEATEVAVRLNWDVDKINLLAASSFSYLVPKETGKDDVSPIPDYPQIIDAPIKKGQKIATIGKTDSEAPRVHFEIRKLGKPLNPVEMLPTK